MNSKLIFSLQEHLKLNQESLLNATILTAGRNQFRSIWVRDYCFAAQALLKQGQHAEVFSALKLIFSFRDQELGLIPRSIDSSKTQWRVAREVLKTVAPFLFGELPITDQLTAEFYGEHQTPAMDSNLLFLHRFIELAEVYPPAQDYIIENQAQLQKLILYYQTYIQDGLIHQLPFSDWQDGVSRKGPTAYLNFLWWSLHRRIERTNLLPRLYSWSECFEKWHSTFSHPSARVYRSLPNSEVVSLETNLFAIEELLRFAPGKAKEIYLALKNHQIWSSRLPGRASFPEYESSSKAWTTRLVGLSGYHDKLIWSWLLAEAYQVTVLMKDEAESAKLKPYLEQLVLSGVGEVYELKDGSLTEWRSPLLKSENPFTWGAAKALEALVTEQDFRKQ